MERHDANHSPSSSFHPMGGPPPMMDSSLALEAPVPSLAQASARLLFVFENAKIVDDLKYQLKQIMTECSHKNIEAGKAWFSDCCQTKEQVEAVLDYMAALSLSRPGFNERLHLIYLINDILFHSERHQLGWVKPGMLPRLVPLLRHAYHCRDGDHAKVLKVLRIWGDNHFFDRPTVDIMRNKIAQQHAPPPSPSQPQQTPMYPSASMPARPPMMRPMPVPPMPPSAMHSMMSTPPPLPPPVPFTYPQGLPIMRPPPAVSGPPPPQPPPPPPPKPYFELPAGSMVPLAGGALPPYTALNPTYLRPHEMLLPPSNATVAALDEFYGELDTHDAFEEREQKLDKNGWEPGYLDSFYAQLRDQRRASVSSTGGKPSSSSRRRARSPSPRGRDEHRRRRSSSRRGRDSWHDAPSSGGSGRRYHRRRRSSSYSSSSTRSSSRSRSRERSY